MPKTTSQTYKPTKAEAMLSLLSDSDEAVASLVMEQLLKQDDCEQFLSDHADTTDSTLHRRLQQISVIIQRRTLHDEFLRKLQLNTQTIWNAAITIDMLYDTQSSKQYLNKMMDDLLLEIPSSTKRLADVTDQLKNLDFKLHLAPVMAPTHYLVGDVLELKEGAAPTLGVIIYRICELRNIPCTFCVYSGRLCLTDSLGNVLDMENGMSITSNVQRNQYQPCTIINFTIILLEQMFATALTDGDSWDCHFLLKLLCEISHIDINSLPYPFGLNPSNL